jgi:uncharacterized protein YkwD
VRSNRRGAQQASIRSRLSAVLAGSLLASLFAFGASAAAPGAASAATPPLYDVETYYLSLVNCTRTGGWVQSDGTCKGYGSGRYSKYVAPLKLGPNLSNVARGWAQTTATSGACAHGDPGARMGAAGFNGHAWGENIGCWDLPGAYKSVLNSHLAMQAEKASNGGHWRNMKNAVYRLVGIGVWRANGHTRVVTDFFAP